MSLSNGLRRWRVRTAAGAIIAASVGLIGVVAASPAHAQGTATATISGATTYQDISGFGASEAFYQANFLMGDRRSVQNKALKLLYSTKTGAGLTILRNDIGSTSEFATIEPTAPASPSATPTYQALGNDLGQEWLATTIQHKYGVNQFFADAWSAPPFMKTNDSDVNGGTLCGVPGATCASGDWQQAYANYLVQYVKDYAADGIKLQYLGFENEANFAPSGYSGMILTPAQTASFADVLGPTLAASGLSTQLECCAAEGWDYAADYASAIEADPVASSYVKLFTSHGYTAPPASPLPGWTNPVWETEWSTFDKWDTAWDDGTDASGLTWAQNIYTGLTSANLSAFLYWWATSTHSILGDNESLIQVNGSTVTPSGRLWAFANYSRFIRPGAVRIAATTADSALDLTAFKNANGSVAVVALNTATSPVVVSFSLADTGIPSSAKATPYLTDATNDTAKQKKIKATGGSFSATLPARSLVTFDIPA